MTADRPPVSGEPTYCDKDARCFRPPGHFGGCTPDPTPVSGEPPSLASLDKQTSVLGARVMTRQAIEEMTRLAYEQGRHDALTEQRRLAEQEGEGRG